MLQTVEYMAFVLMVAAGAFYSMPETAYDVTSFLYFMAVLAFIYSALSGIFAAIDMRGWYDSSKIQQDTCTSGIEYMRSSIRVFFIFVLVVTPVLCLFWLYVMPFRRSLGYNLNTSRLGC